MTNPKIRPFTIADRPDIRHIAWETGDKGHSVDKWFGDKGLFGDLITRYYTDFEPQSVWVVEDSSHVTGYLSGCTNTQRFKRIMAWRIVPTALFRALSRHPFLDDRTRHWIRLNLSLGTTVIQRQLPLAAYPAHLHINLLSSNRRQNTGRLLIETFLSHLTEAGIPGVHASVREDNAPGIRFFEKMGFHILHRQPFMRIDETTSGLLFSFILGRQLKP